VSQKFLTIARKRFRETAKLEDGGTRGGVTWGRYVTAMQQYGEAILREGGWLTQADCERLETALSCAEAALRPPRRPGLDLAIGQLRLAVEAADAVLATAAG
jgi:hypothetical protein